MKPWSVIMAIVLAGSLSACSKNPTGSSTDPTPTRTPVPAHATATPTHIPGGGVLPTVTPGGTVYTVKYEIIGTSVSSYNLTYLDSDTTSKSLTGVPGGTWSQTVSLSAGYEAVLIVAYLPASVSPSVTLNIYVNGIVKSTLTQNGIGPAMTCSYWLP
jgi:hypothetical protein